MVDKNYDSVGLYARRPFCRQEQEISAHLEVRPPERKFFLLTGGRGFCRAEKFEGRAPIQPRNPIDNLPFNNCQPQSPDLPIRQFAHLPICPPAD